MKLWPLFVFQIIRHAKLKRFAHEQLQLLPVHFPYYPSSGHSDPEKINAIYPEYEWSTEGPAGDLSEVSHERVYVDKELIPPYRK